MDKFKGKYRIPSARWASWDYSRNAAYFITICTANRVHDFGEIAGGTMVLTPVGQAAVDCWNEIPAHFPFVVLDGFVVMPNHVHGILVIDKPDDHPDATVVETQNFASLQWPPEQSEPPQPPNRFGPQSQNLASIVRGYKIGVTKFARLNNLPFVWLARYHDHVIRNPNEHERIRQYILTNPQRWAEDKFYAPRRRNPADHDQ